MTVLIIGGGIGGLTAALFLHQAGIDCRVYEAASELKEIGVGVNIQSHAVRALAKIGLLERLAKVALEPKERRYYTLHGQFIHAVPGGVHAGYKYPHYSIHRGLLHSVLLAAVKERLGEDAVVTGHKCRHIEQDETGVTVHFEPLAGEAHHPPQRGDLAIGCDGIHSAVRRQLYPEEGPPKFAGVNMWRGVTRARPFLGGATNVGVGTMKTGKLVIYPICNFDDGTQLINWVAEVEKAQYAGNDWKKAGRLEDFIDYFKDCAFDWLDVPALLAGADAIFEYPMVDRDPLPRWTFGRITLLGDAAHPMYPRGGNGAAQAILDADALASAFGQAATSAAAFEAYENARRDATARIVQASRTEPPDIIMSIVEERTQGKRFDDIEKVISQAELKQIMDNFGRTAGLDIKTVNAADSR